MKRCVLAVFAFVFGSITCLHAQEGSNSVRLVVNGEGPTKTEATKQALRSAIEQAFGTFVSANTSILNDDIVRDEIATVSSGNVESFKEISSTKYPDGITSVTLEAVVSIGKLVSYSKAHGSSAEFSGSTLMYNNRLRQLNKENEAKALMNILIKLDKIYTTFWDYRIEIGEPTEGYAETIALDPRYQYSSKDKGRSSSWKRLSGRRSGWILPFSIHVSPTVNFTAFIFELEKELKAISGQEKPGISNSETLIRLPYLRNDHIFVEGFAESLVHYLDPLACFEVVLQGQSEYRYTLKSLRDFTDIQKRVFDIPYPYLDSETLILDGDSYSTTQNKTSLFSFSYESIYEIVWNGSNDKTLECRLFLPGESIESVTGLSVAPIKETVIDHKGAFLERYTGVQDNLQIMPFDAVKELDLSEIGVPLKWPDWSQKNGEVIIDCNANLIFIVPEGRCMRFETDKSPDQFWKKDGDVQELDFKSPDCRPLWLRYAPGKRAVMEVAQGKRYRMASRAVTQKRVFSDSPHQSVSENNTQSFVAVDKKPSSAPLSDKASAQDGTTPQTKAEPAKEVYNVTVFSDPSVNALPLNESIVLPVGNATNPPRFNGGDFMEFKKWVNSVLQYPSFAKENGVQGRVMIRFTITADGGVSDVSVEKGVDQSLDEEAVRVVSHSPKWIPAVHEGHRVPVSVLFPIIFQLR